MKQSSIDWLVDQMFKQGFFDGNKPLSYTTLDHLQHQAKEMHKEEIKVAYLEGSFEKMRHLNGKEPMMPSEYYNETFNTEEK